MPSLVQSVMADAAKTRFRGFNLSLPTIAATGRPPNVGQFLANPNPATLRSAPTAASLLTITKPGTLAGSVGKLPLATPAIPQAVPPAMIKAASNAKVDVDFQAEVSGELSKLIDAMCQSIVNAHNMWRQQAVLKDVKISAITANGGSIQGPSLSPLIKSQIPGTALFGTAATIAQAVADGLDGCWQSWQSSVRVPGLPWWPSFVAVPGPLAPPTPNVPSPLSALTWNAATISADVMTQTMKSKQLTLAPFSGELFASIATGFARALELWFPSQQVTNVLGKGPVPTFAPPYVPVGPVVAGDTVAQLPNFLS